MREVSNFGRWLKQALAERGISQKEFAVAIGIKESAVSRYIHENRIPRHDIAARMTRFFDTQPVWDVDNLPDTTPKEKPRSITLRQLLYYLTEDEFIQICSGHDGWDEFIEFPAKSKLLEPFKDRRIICLGVEGKEDEDTAVIRVEIAEEGE